MLTGLGQKAPQRASRPFVSSTTGNHAAGGKRAPNPVVVSPAERGKPVVFPVSAGKASRKGRR